MIDAKTTLLLSTLVGRDVSPEITLANNSFLGIAQALENKNEQMFVSAHWRELDKFLLSDAGKEATKNFVHKWMDSRNPKNQLDPDNQDQLKE